MNPPWAFPASKDFMFSGGDISTNEWDVSYYNYKLEIWEQSGGNPIEGMVRKVGTEEISLKTKGLTTHACTQRADEERQMCRGTGGMGHWEEYCQPGSGGRGRGSL